MVFDLTDDQKAFQSDIERFASEQIAPHAAAIDQSDTFPRELVRAVARHGLMGATIAKAWGGQGRDYLSYALGIEALAKSSSVLAVIAAVCGSSSGSTRVAPTTVM